MSRLGSTEFKECYFTHVSYSRFSYTPKTFSATIKDAWTAHLTKKWIESQFDCDARKPDKQKKIMAKQIIFLACFIFEDIGQVLIQE